MGGAAMIGGLFGKLISKAAWKAGGSAVLGFLAPYALPLIVAGVVAVGGAVAWHFWQDDKVRTRLEQAETARDLAVSQKDALITKTQNLQAQIRRMNDREDERLQRERDRAAEMAQAARDAQLQRDTVTEELRQARQRLRESNDAEYQHWSRQPWPGRALDELRLVAERDHAERQ